MLTLVLCSNNTMLHAQDSVCLQIKLWKQGENARFHTHVQLYRQIKIWNQAKKSWTMLQSNRLLSSCTQRPPILGKRTWPPTPPRPENEVLAARSNQLPPNVKRPCLTGAIPHHHKNMRRSNKKHARKEGQKFLLSLNCGVYCPLQKTCLMFLSAYPPHYCPMEPDVSPMFLKFLAKTKACAGNFLSPQDTLVLFSKNTMLHTQDSVCRQIKTRKQAKN